MSTLTTDRCTRQGALGRCRGRVWWVWSEVSRRQIPIDPNPVPAGTTGALVLIGNKVFSLLLAIQRLQQMYRGDDDATAHTKAHEDWPWHLPHAAVCEARGERQPQ